MPVEAQRQERGMPMWVPPSCLQKRIIILRGCIASF
jgi:hypothetical protein